MIRVKAEGGAIYEVAIHKDISFKEVPQEGLAQPRYLYEAMVNGAAVTLASGKTKEEATAAFQAVLASALHLTQPEGVEFVELW